jgi:hypothetical protein
MFVPGWQAALVVIAALVLAGAAIGVILTSVVHRSRTTLGLVIGGALLGALGLLIGVFLVGWADAHAAFENGHRLDIAPWGENLWLRNRIVENSVLICLIPACVFPLLGLSVRYAFRRRQLPETHGVR